MSDDPYDLRSLTDAELKALGREAGIEVKLPSDPDWQDPRAGDSSVEPPEEAAADLPPLMTAADLLSEEPLAALPVEPPDDETPPDEAAPTFVVVKNAYGPGVPSVKFATGTPVGTWLDAEHHDLSGAEVQTLLARMGLDEVYPGRSAWFGKQRDKALKARKQLADTPEVQAFAEEESRRFTAKQKVQAAFVEAQRKKERK